MAKNNTTTTQQEILPKYHGKKICILANTGNAGKTTVATYLLHPRMKAKIFSVETRNRSSKDLGVSEADVAVYKGNEFGKLLEDIIFEDTVIIDVGTSNIDAFFQDMEKYQNAFSEFDMIIIPVVAEEKSDKEAIHLIRELSSFSLSPSRLFFLPNRIPLGQSPKALLPNLYHEIETEKLATIFEDCFIQETELFEFLSKTGLSLESLIENGGENGELYRSEARDAQKQGLKEKQITYASLYRWHRLAAPVKEKLDFVFARIVSLL